jgi:hypothetical protein
MPNLLNLSVGTTLLLVEYMTLKSVPSAQDLEVLHLLQSAKLRMSVVLNWTGIIVGQLRENHKNEFAHLTNH